MNSESVKTANRQGGTMTKADLVEEVSRITEVKRKESEVIVETIFDSIMSALRNKDKVEIRGFGSFRTRQRRGRIGRNPKTGEKVDVPPKTIPFFKPSKDLKDLINQESGQPGSASPAAGEPIL
jgi:integration host factor subunit beta